jgi:hypothetical protein
MPISQSQNMSNDRTRSHAPRVIEPHSKPRHRYPLLLSEKVSHDRVEAARESSVLRDESFYIDGWTSFLQSNERFEDIIILEVLRSVPALSVGLHHIHPQEHVKKTHLWCADGKKSFNCVVFITYSIKPACELRGMTLYPRMLRFRRRVSPSRPRTWFTRSNTCSMTAS